MVRIEYTELFLYLQVFFSVIGHLCFLTGTHPKLASYFRLSLNWAPVCPQRDRGTVSFGV